MNQMSCSDFEYASKRKHHRRERSLAEMARVAPRIGLLVLIEPYFPKVGDGRKFYPLEPMLPIRLLQNWIFLK